MQTKPLYNAFLFPILLALVATFTVLFPSSAKADLQQTAIDECVLEHLVSAKLDSASRLITRSCEENYHKPNFLTERRKQYNACLLRHLKGVESEFAVHKILQVCEKKHLRFGASARN